MFRNAVHTLSLRDTHPRCRRTRYAHALCTRRCTRSSGSTGEDDDVRYGSPSLCTRYLCTRYAHTMHTLCTHSAYKLCTHHAHTMHTPCTRTSGGAGEDDDVGGGMLSMHTICTRYLCTPHAHRMHTHSAHTTHTPCTRTSGGAGEDDDVGGGLGCGHELASRARDHHLAVLHVHTGP
eukprot:3228504-Rhodomonas_salina.1